MFTPRQWHVLWALTSLLTFGLGVVVGLLASRGEEERLQESGSDLVLCLDVVDGDTIRVELDGTSTDVRILGIDCPETRRGRKLSRQAETAGLEEEQMLKYGQIATQTTRSWLEGRTIRLVFPDNEIRRGSFGRVLAYVEQEGVDIGERLLLGGNAFTSPEQHPRMEPYRLFQQEARLRGKGFWYRAP